MKKNIKYVQTYESDSKNILNKRLEKLNKDLDIVLDLYKKSKYLEEIVPVINKYGKNSEKTKLAKKSYELKVSKYKKTVEIVIGIPKIKKEIKNLESKIDKSITNN